MRRRTKIVCTVGPASNDYNTIQAMHEEGLDAVRINMSHASHDDAEQTLGVLRDLNKKLDHPIPVLLDTRGPEIRTEERLEPLNLVEDTQVLVQGSDSPAKETHLPRIRVIYNRFEDALVEGDTIRLDNGLIQLKVKCKSHAGLICRVQHGGKLGSKKHVNLPGVHVQLPSISKQDKENLLFAKQQKISWIAQSFVRSADDVQSLRELLGSANEWVKIIAKIENQEGVHEAENIAKAADGIMVARGDLGIETDIATLPRLQRHLVHTTLRLGRRCFVATHMLESMIEHPIPTRAEAIDVANAVYEGVDSVILSAETSVGQHPVLAVKQLRNIIEDSEKVPGLNFADSLVSTAVKQNIARSAVRLASRIKAVGVLVITRTGYMADLVTNCGPLDFPIFAFSNRPETRQRLMVNRGVFSYHTSLHEDPKLTVSNALSILSKSEGVESGEKIVLVSDVLTNDGVESIQVWQTP